ncbi:MAG: flagellar motor switch protein FliG [Bdellovibrionales bacterium]|jgi:flagellar motor switch protein FliG|nr:flagellar motor switch protein FliG [Bdellovibrionales bacterium]
MRVREDYRTLTGTEKASILLLSLGEEYTAKIFEQLDEEEILHLSHTMSNLGKVSSTVIERLFIEFAESITSTNSLVGTLDSTERLLAKVLGKDKVQNIMEEIRGPAGRTMWEKLSNVNEEILATYLQKEYPQTVAVVLSKITPEHSAKVLAQLPEGFAMEVVMRMLRMEAVQKEVLDDVEKTLRSEFMPNLSRASRRDSYEVMAEIFNNLDRSMESKFMSSLEERNPDAAERIRSLMFTFEDLGKLDPGAIQTLIRSADKEKLPIALKGASDAMKDLFFSNMSERAGKIMKEDMAAMGPIRLKDVEEAQQRLVNTATDLADRGEITIVTAKDEDELIY